MKRSIIFLSFSLVALSACNLKGQQKIKNQSFGSVAGKSSYQGGAAEVIQKVEEKTYPGLHAGDVAPDAVKIDADNISEIVNGVCIVQKNDLQAAVDLKGNLIIPWDKVKLSSSSPFCTLISVTKGITGGYVNVKGQKVTTLNFNNVDKFDCHKLASIEDFYYKPIAIDTRGNVVSDKGTGRVYDLYERELYNKTQTLLVRFPKDHHYGYMTLAGKEVISSKYDDATQFTDGMAAVMKMDQFGIRKWGYINTSGTLVIPYTFQNKPGQFHDELALVTPAEKTSFDFAYIDKTGKIKFTIGDGNSIYSHLSLRDEVSTEGFFVNGYSFWNFASFGGIDYKILNTTGQFIKLEDVMKVPPVPISKNGLYIYKYDDMGIYYRNGGTFLNNAGIVDYQGNSIFPSEFYSIQPDYFSPYAVATIKKSPNERANNSSFGNIFGVVNRQGVFVMILADKPKF